MAKNDLISFEGRVITESQMDAMRRGDLQPIRDWQEEPTLLQRLRAAIRFAPDPRADYVRGLDRSKWQGNWNIQKTIDAGYRYAFIKATQNNFTDERFDYAVNIAANANFPIGVYHFGDPYGVSAIQQAQYFASVVDGVGELSVVLDQEWKGNLSPTGLLNWMLDFMGELGVHLGDRLKEIYSTALWLNANVAPHDWEADGVDLWVARWNRYLTGPWSDGNCIPRDWTNWRNWQDSGDGNNMGPILGMDSDDCDTDYFRGDWDAFVAHYMPAPEPPGVIERIVVLETLVAQNIISIDQNSTAIVNNRTDINDLQSWKVVKDAKDAEQDDRLDALEGGNPPSSDILLATAKPGEKAVVYELLYYDEACKNEDPPENDPQGKPYAEPPKTGRIIYTDKNVFGIKAKAKESCKDTEPLNHIIKGAGFDFCVIADGYPGAGSFVRADKIMLVE